MKSHFARFFLIFCLSAGIGALSAEPRPAGAWELYEEVISTLKTDLAPHRYPLTAWFMKKGKITDEAALAEDVREKKWSKARLGVLWNGAPDRPVWLRREVALPDSLMGVPLKGSKVFLAVNLAGDVGLFVDGEKRADANFRGAANVLLSDAAEPGRTYRVALRVVPGRDGVGMLQDAYLTFGVLEESKKRTDAFVMQVQSIQTLLDLAPDPSEGWKKALNEAVAEVDLKARGAADEKTFVASLDRASAKLAPLGKWAKKFTVYLVGYSHIDLAWLWDYEEGKIVIRDTVNTIDSLMSDYPDFTYTQTQAQAAKWMEVEHPDVFEKIKKRFAEGRFELVGGTWSEHDSNIPSGESFVRQFLYGTRYFKEKFGKDIKIAWTPDSFGYNWNLPQILKKSGMTGFLTQKISWNDTTSFPYNIFWWEGPDGSRILTYFPAGGYGESVDPLTMVEQLKKVRGRHGVDDHLVIFGIGDHGGGVTRGHLDRAEAARKDPSYPNVVYTTGEKYFQHLNELSKTHDFPVWNDELYLQKHRGTATSQSNTKKNNRKGEILLENAEKFSEIARGMGRPWPGRNLMDAWEIVLLNHMHDILPGSGIRKVYEDADRDYAVMREKAGAALSGALETIAGRIDTTGEGRAAVLFNPVAWERDGAVAIPLDSLPENPGVIDPAGNPVPSQIVEEDGEKKLLFVAKGLPALGHAVYRIAPNGPKPPGGNLRADSARLENDVLRVAIDPSTGFVSSLIHKPSGREAIEPGTAGGAALMLYAEDPKSSDAWDFSLRDRLDLAVVSPPEIVENGPVRAAIKTTYKIQGSTFEQTLRFYADSDMMEGRIDVNWLARHTMGKLGFHMNVTADKVWCEIPYAAIPRPAFPKTREEEAKWEVSGHKWADYSDADGSFGMTLLNDSKYGWDVKEKLFRLSLIRGSAHPDPQADIGKHSIFYAAHPHAGDWRDAGAPRRGIEFNHPVIPVLAESHAGDLPKRKSWYASSPENVQLTVVKKAEDSDDAVLRLYESHGRDGTATVELPAAPKKVYETDLMEKELREIPFSGNKIETPIGHFEIKTLKVVW